MRTGSKLRAATLLCFGAFCVHQLRFALASEVAGTQPASDLGHGYLTLLAPLIVGALAVGLAHFLVVLARASRLVDVPWPRRGLRRLWALATAALIFIYTTQELLEGLLSQAHPAGFAGVFGSGGWIAVVAALAVGALIALALRGADAALARAAGRCRQSGRRPDRSPSKPRFHALPVARNQLADHLAGRGPPPAVDCL